MTRVAKELYHLVNGNQVALKMQQQQQQHRIQQEQHKQQARQKH